MQNNREYRKRARVVLGGNIFANAWLYLALAVLLSGLLSSVIPFIGYLIVVGPASMGFASYNLQLVRDTDRKNTFDPLLDGCRGNVANNIVLGLLYTLLTFLWSLLLIVPGIIKWLAYSQAYYISLEHPEYDAMTCLKESEKMMNGHKKEYFCLMLSFIGWWIVGLACFGIGTAWVSAYAQTASAFYYEDLKTEPIFVQG